MSSTKENSKYKTIGEVAKLLNLINKKKVYYQLILYAFGKKNLNKLNLKFLQAIEDIMMKIPSIF